jgi:hypothetical protein
MAASYEHNNGCVCYRLYILKSLKYCSIIRGANTILKKKYFEYYNMLYLQIFNYALPRKNELHSYNRSQVQFSVF